MIHNDAGAAAVILPVIHNLSGALGVRSVLDVGCSHGYAVSWLWRHGIKASGLDVSSIAIAKAKAARGEEPSQCVPPCFAQGSATLLPWGDGAFDAIMSTDVLEHLEADEVTPALKELTRVAGKMLVLKIASRGDAVHSLQASKLAAHLQAAAAAGGGVVGGDDVAVPAGSVAAGAAVALPRNLHPTVHRPEWWAAQIVQLGFRQHSRIPHPPRRPWMCCTTVFVRDSSRDSG